MMNPEMVQRFMHIPLPDTTGTTEVAIVARDSNVVLRNADSDHLLSAEFNFDPAQRSEPVMEYQQGKVTIYDPVPTSGRVRAPGKWDVALNPGIPLDIDAQVSSGRLSIHQQDAAIETMIGRCDSGGLSADLEGNFVALEELALGTSSGSMAVRLAGSFPTLEEAVFDSSSGGMDVKLHGVYGTLHQLTLHQSSGQMGLLLLDAVFEQGFDVDIHNSSGDCRIACHGATYTDDVEISVTNASGNVLLLLPIDVGIDLKVTARAGTVEVADLQTHAHGHYRSGGFDAAAVALYINVQSASGNVTVMRPVKSYHDRDDT